MAPRTLLPELLEALWKADEWGLSTEYLTRQLKMSRASVFRHLRRLESKELIEKISKSPKEICERGRPAVWYRFTPKAYDVIFCDVWTTGYPRKRLKSVSERDKAKGPRHYVRRFAEEKAEDDRRKKSMEKIAEPGHYRARVQRLWNLPPDR